MVRQAQVVIAAERQQRLAICRQCRLLGTCDVPPEPIQPRLFSLGQLALKITQDAPPASSHCLRRIVEQVAIGLLLYHFGNGFLLLLFRGTLASLFRPDTQPAKHLHVCIGLRIRRGQ